MTTTSAIQTGAAQAAGVAKTAASAKSLANTKDMFLSLLTTQMKYQDPLSPMDTSQFTQQLVQYTSVEQQIAQNDKLDQLIALQSGGFGGALNYLGREVETSSGAFSFDGSESTLSYETPADAKSITVQILDETGHVAFTGSGSADAGRHSVRWDGRTDAGSMAPAGNYTLRIVGQNSADESIAGTAFSTGRVTGIETQDGETVLMMGDTAVKLSEVLAVRS